MDAAALRELQAPLKQKYRDDPDSARAHLEAEAAFSGDGSNACSGDMLLQALLACAGVTMRSVATAMGIDIRAAALRASTEMDARGTLGVSREAEVGLGDIEVVAELDTDADESTLAKLAQLTERYCV